MTEQRPSPRLAPLTEDKLSEAQKAMRDSLQAGPRGKISMDGPFGIWMNAPEFGQLAQQLGAHCRFKTAVPPRLSEFAILCTARRWRAQYEWEAHAPIAERAGVSAETIEDIRRGRRPRNAPEDELLIYDFVQELYRDRRVSDQLYARAVQLFGEPGTIEFVGILGYYTLISMTLNVFRAPTSPDKPLPFREPLAG